MTIPAEKVTQLNLIYDYTPILALITGDLSTYTVTADSGTDTFTAAGHDYIDGTPVEFSNAGGALPGGLVAGTTYYVTGAATDTFQVTEFVGGTALDITSNGSGTNTVTEVAIEGIASSYEDASLVWDVLVRHEVSDYQGAGRVSFTWPGAAIDGSQAVIASTSASVIPVNDTITFRYVAIIRGGNTTPGDGTGSLAILQDVGETTITLQGYTFTFNPTYL